MKTAREVYQISLRLLGERNGENTASLEERAVDLINVMLGDLQELDEALRGKRVHFGTSLPQIDSLEERLCCEEVIASSLLPLGLAAMLIHEEDPSRAAFFYEMYSGEMQRLFGRCRRGRRHSIRRPY
jgi:hypothetical protein